MEDYCSKITVNGALLVGFQSDTEKLPSRQGIEQAWLDVSVVKNYYC